MTLPFFRVPHPESELEKIYKDSKIKKYGTPEGLLEAWDTRGRGRKEEDVDIGRSKNYVDVNFKESATPHPRYGPQVKVFESGQKNIGRVNIAIDPANPKKEEIINTQVIPITNKVSQLVDKYGGRGLNDFTIANLPSSGFMSQTFAAYSNDRNELKLTAGLLNPENRAKMVSEVDWYLKTYGLYANSSDPIAVKNIDDLAPAIITHELGHKLMADINIQAGLKQNEKVVSTYRSSMTPLREELSTIKSKYSMSWKPMKPEDETRVKEIETSMRKIKTQYSKERNKFFYTKEWNKLYKEEAKAGWKVPTKYGKVDSAEGFAECFTLHEYGYDNLLTPKISEYIEKAKKMVKP